MTLRTHVSRFLIAAGAIGLAAVAGVRADSVLGEERARVQLEAAFDAAEASAPDTREWSDTRRAQWEASRTAPIGAPVGRLSIPALGLEVSSSTEPTS